MLRSLVIVAAAGVSSAVSAQPSTGVPTGAGSDCQMRIEAAPSTWIIPAYDPFSNTIPEGTFGITFSNYGSAECKVVPVFQLDQPPFGLSRGTGKPIRYAVLNLTDARDVTPRPGRTQRGLTDKELILASNESRTMLFKLVANPDDIDGAGTFTEHVTIELQDSRFRAVAGQRIVLGLDVLPSARLGLSGEYQAGDGHAVVNLGNLREGLAPIPLQLRVNSTGRYSLNVSSANVGQLRLGSTDWYVPYSLAIAGASIGAGGTVTSPAGSAFRRDSLPIQFIIGDTTNRRAGTYSDIVFISVSAM